MAYFYVPLSAIDIKTDLIPPNAGFQYFNTPLFHNPTAFIYGKADLLRPGSEDQAFNTAVNIKSRRHPGGCRLRVRERQNLFQ